MPVTPPAGRRIVRAPLLALLLLALPAPASAAAEVGSETGLALPRFVSVAVGEANVRSGPNTRNPILWQYRRRGLPVLVTAELEGWRRVRDQSGGEGWMHVRLLSGRRTVAVAGGIRRLHGAPGEGARVLLRLEPGVLADLLDCEAAWCRVDVPTPDGERRGWLRRGDLWGVLPGESRG